MAVAENKRNFRTSCEPSLLNRSWGISPSSVPKLKMAGPGPRLAFPSPSFRELTYGQAIFAGQLWSEGWFSCITHVRSAGSRRPG
jgi:hypothetical protein